MLMKKVEAYLAVRRAAGFELGVPGFLLRSFARFAADQGDTFVRTSTVIRWASQAPSLNQREHRLQVVIRLARYLRAEEEGHEVPPRGIFRRRKTRRTPYIFTHQEVSELIQAATCLQPSASIRPHTYCTLLALLYVTGLRISEALALDLDDIVADGLIIRKTKFKKSRLIPLHESAAAGIQRYIGRRRCFATEHKRLFISDQGRTLSRFSVSWVFRGLLKTVGLSPGRGGRQPRIHDFRHSYACRALEACPEGRDNVGRHMLALSTYMGHTHVSDTYWYLEATPTLMQDIATNCEAFLTGGLPCRR